MPAVPGLPAGEPGGRDTWGRFKTRLAEDVTDLAAYGQIKAGPWVLLMQLAEAWAAEEAWRPDEQLR